MNTATIPTQANTTSPALTVVKAVSLPLGAARRDKLMVAELDRIMERSHGKMIPHAEAKKRLGL